MGDRIKYNTDYLRSTAAQLRTCSYQHMDAIDRVINLVNGLPDVWEGTSEKKFMEVFAQMEISFEQFDETLEAFAKTLEICAEAMEQADKQLLHKINSIG